MEAGAVEHVRVGSRALRQVPDVANGESQRVHLRDSLVPESSSCFSDYGKFSFNLFSLWKILVYTSSGFHLCVPLINSSLFALKQSSPDNAQLFVEVTYPGACLSLPYPSISVLLEIP